jgi:hypothetical protein
MRAIFRLREAIVAVPVSNQALTIVTVPRDAMLEVMGEPQKSGLVEVLWEGRHIAVFVQDIESRGELVEIAKAGTR